MVVYIKYKDKTGNIHKVKARRLKPNERWNPCLFKKSYKTLGESTTKNNGYTGCIIGVKIPPDYNSVVQLADGLIIEVQYFSRWDSDLVIKESLMR